MTIVPTMRVASINSSGRQAASFIRVAAAVGWEVRAQMKDCVGIVAQELCSYSNVTVVLGSLSDPKVIDSLFSQQIDVAFINTTHWGDEVAIGKHCALAAQKAGAKHIIYSSMPDYSRYGMGWDALPLWSDKYIVENFIESLSVPSTFVYCGIYHNNFTSLPYPLFRMELLDDGSFEWQAPFRRDKPLPWLDAEHDVGPVVLQIFKDGPSIWGGKRIPLAFDYLTPEEVCRAFSNALQRPVNYVRGPIDIEISIPHGYREQLSAIETVLGVKEVPYFGPDLETQCTDIAMKLWEGHRSIEEFAREVFPVEESNNGLTWMEENDDNEPSREIAPDFTILSF